MHSCGITGSTGVGVHQYSNPPGQERLTYAGGHETLVVTGEPWPSDPGPGTADDLYDSQDVVPVPAADLVQRLRRSSATPLAGLIGEGRSMATLELVGRQIALLDALWKLDRPFLVLVRGKPSILPARALGADAIVQAFTPGMQAVGRSPSSCSGAPSRAGGCQSRTDQGRGRGRGSTAQVRRSDTESAVRLQRGPQLHGGARLGPDDPESVVTSTGTLRATVTPTRTGRRPARKTVQANARARFTRVTWTARQVKAFTQVCVERANGSR